jgi:hypothetical protein
VLLPGNRGEVAYYRTVVSKGKNSIDGDVSTKLSSGEYKAMRKIEREHLDRSLEAAAELLHGGRDDRSFLEEVDFEDALDHVAREDAADNTDPSTSQVTFQSPAVQRSPPDRYPGTPRGPPHGQQDSQDDDDESLDLRGQTAGYSELLGAVKDLTRMVSTMDGELQQLRVAPVPPVPAAPPPVPIRNRVPVSRGVPPRRAVPQPVPPGTRGSSVPTGTDLPPSHWYAVAKGLPGLDDKLYSTEGEARLAVGDVASGGSEHFTDKASALLYLERCRELVKASKPSPALPSDPERRMPDLVPPQNHIYAQQQHDAAYPNGHQYPPSFLGGVDPSEGVDDKVFGLDIASSPDLATGLVPPGLGDTNAASVVAGMVDVVGLPGALQAGDSDGARMATAVGDIAALGHMEKTGHRPDHAWKTLKRTSLSTVTNAALLRARATELTKLRSTVIKHLMGTTKAIFRKAGWVDEACINAWAFGGFVARIVHDGLNNYISLHFHLLEQVHQGLPWSYIQQEIDHHVHELGSPRGLYPTRAQALCGVYIYLRDGAANSWHSTTLQTLRNQEMYALLSGPGAGGPGGGSAICKKCMTALHGGSTNSCPWKRQSDAVARQYGAKALTNLGESMAEE